MNLKPADFRQDTIALLRLIYLVPGWDYRAYTHKALLRPLVKANLIRYSGQKGSQNGGQINITPLGLAFLREHKLDCFGFEQRHLEQYPEQCANNAALMDAMTKFTGRYES